MKENIFISIIIVTWNVENFIKKCLQSIIEQSFKKYEVLVIDNHSTDKTKTILKEQFSFVTLIENDHNVGFCAANNQGIDRARGNYALCLNSDITLHPDFLRQLIIKIEKSSPSIGMYTGTVLTTKKEIYSTGISLTKSLRFKSDTLNKADGMIVWGVNAAAALYSKKMLADIKIGQEYFDNDFFFLVEDVDLSYRANLLGWKALYVKPAYCYHEGNCSCYPKKYRQYLSFRNRYYLLIKNQTLRDLIKRFFYMIPYDLIRAVYLIFTNKYFFKGIKDIIISLPKMLKKRELIKQKILLKGDSKE